MRTFLVSLTARTADPGTALDRNSDAIAYAVWTLSAARPGDHVHGQRVERGRRRHVVSAGP